MKKILFMLSLASSLAMANTQTEAIAHEAGMHLRDVVAHFLEAIQKKMGSEYEHLGINQGLIDYSLDRIEHVADDPMSANMWADLENSCSSQDLDVILAKLH